jgi:hypothetical protein
MYYIGHRAYLSSPINSHLIVFPNRLAILKRMWRRGTFSRIRCLDKALVLIKGRQPMRSQ